MNWFPGIALGLLMALAASCGGSPEATTSALDGPVMRYPEPASGGDREDAEVRGQLQLDGDCLYVALDELDERYPVVWPAGTTWDADDERVIAPSGAAMPVGSDVSGGGGYHDVDDVGRLLGDEAQARAASCVDNTYGEIALVNNADDGIRPAE